MGSYHYRMARVFIGIALLMSSAILQANDDIDGDGASGLEHTRLVATADAAINEGENVIYCATFQLAWQALEEALGKPLLLQPHSFLAESLHHQQVPQAIVAPQDSLVYGGPRTPESIAELKRTARKRWPDTNLDGLLPEDMQEDGGPPQLLGYALLIKELNFETRFDRLQYPLYFADTYVSAFGFKSYYDDKEPVKSQSKQAVVHYYDGPNRYIVELKTTSSDDTLLLAAIPKPDSLIDGWHEVLRLIHAERTIIWQTLDCLEIPLLDFEIRKNYGSLEEYKVKDADFTVKKAIQLLNFRLDEKGAAVESKGEALGLFGGPEHSVIFDKPFMLIVKRQYQKFPYLICWIGNSKLMVKSKEPEPFYDEDEDDDDIEGQENLGLFD